MTQVVKWNLFDDIQEMKSSVGLCVYFLFISHL